MTANRERERGTRVMKGNEGREGWCAIDGRAEDRRSGRGQMHGYNGCSAK